MGVGARARVKRPRNRIACLLAQRKLIGIVGRGVSKTISPFLLLAVPSACESFNSTVFDQIWGNRMNVNLFDVGDRGALLVGHM